MSGPTLRNCLVLLVGVLFAPASAYAQSAIAGTTRDASGAILHSVNVEASSPALIEKPKSATPDSAGQYRIVDLRPGAYAVSLTLTGFSTFPRDGILLEA